MRPDRSKRIIILTADAGFGHRKAADAVAAALQEAYGDACSADVVNPLDDRRVLPLLRNSQADSDRFSRDMREIFDRGWNASRAAVPAASLGGALTVALFNVMRDILRTYRPDAIINTYPLYHPPLASVFALTRRRTPLYTVVTDFGVVHSLWFSRAAAACFVATETGAPVSHRTRTGAGEGAYYRHPGGPRAGGPIPRPGRDAGGAGLVARPAGYAGCRQ